MMIRCLIVEDHLMFSQLIAGMLRAFRNMEIVGTAGTVAEGLRACEAHKPDLVLLDLALPDGSGLAVGEKLIELNPDARIIILSGQMQTFVCPAKLKPFVHDVVDKAGAFEEVENAIKLCLEDIRRSDYTPAQRKLDDQRKRTLSKRENEVFRMIGAGLISKEIADEMGLSIHTVYVYRKRIAEKLNLSGADVTREAIRDYQRTLGTDSTPP
jgi:DNA-binding NarL/FixJ family response regulator